MKSYRVHLTKQRVHFYSHNNYGNIRLCRVPEKSKPLLVYATADEAVAYMLYGCFFLFFTHRKK